MRNLILYICAMGLALSSCVELDRLENTSAGEKVSVSLSVSVCNDEGTRSVDESKIHNLWVVQFSGTSPDSKVLGEPIYIEDFTNFDGQIELIQTDAPCNICFIANTFEGPGEFDVNLMTTIDDILNLRRVASDEDGLLGTSGEMGDDGQKEYYTMFNSWIKVDKVDDELEILHTTLRRNVAKVTITLSLGESALEDKVRIASLQFCSVPSASFYVTNRSDNELSAPFPLLQSFKKVNYAPIPWVDADNDNSMKLEAYLPVNMRGNNDLNPADPDGQSMKNKYAPEGATYLLVSAVYGDNDYPITYTFYLGENMITDYNLKANHSYSYNFNITSKGVADTDYRVTDWGLVDFTDIEKYPLANSYILNPNLTEGVWRYFRIPLEKANIFWGGQGYEPKNTNMLLDENSWECFVLASDFQINENNFRIVESSGNKDKQYFEVAVQSGVRGNVIVAAGTSTTSISWSWHLWITDYDPSHALALGEGISCQYIYPVTEGSVHRYAGEFWDSHTSSYMMDRNLGSISADSYSPENEGFLYYQFGRKDPFFVSSDAYYYSGANNDRVERVSYATANQEGLSGVRYSVQNPLKFIEYKDGTDTYWTYGNNYNPSVFDKTIIWNDPTTATGNENEGKKSFFDPCPPGYRVPVHNVFEDFAYNDSQKPTTNVLKQGSGAELQRGFISFSLLKGLQYWPYDGNTIPDKVIYFPALGHHESKEETLAYFKADLNGRYMSLWSCVQMNSKQAYRLFTREGNVTWKTLSTDKSRGLPVRCITDN